MSEIDPRLGKQMDVDECIEQAEKEEKNPWPKRKTAWGEATRRAKDQGLPNPGGAKRPLSAKDVVRKRLKG